LSWNVFSFFTGVFERDNSPHNRLAMQRKGIANPVVRLVRHFSFWYWVGKLAVQADLVGWL